MHRPVKQRLFRRCLCRINLFKRANHFFFFYFSMTDDASLETIYKLIIWFHWKWRLLPGARLPCKHIVFKSPSSFCLNALFALLNVRIHFFFIFFSLIDNELTKIEEKMLSLFSDWLTLSISNSQTQKKNNQCQLRVLKYFRLLFYLFFVLFVLLHVKPKMKSFLHSILVVSLSLELAGNEKFIFKKCMNDSLFTTLFSSKY